MNARKRLGELEDRFESLDGEIQALKRRIPVPKATQEPSGKIQSAPEFKNVPAAATTASSPEDSIFGGHPDESTAPLEPASGSAPPPLSDYVFARQSAIREGIPPQSEPSAPSTSPPSQPLPDRFHFDKINWEQFMGVRLFAWLGGLRSFWPRHFSSSFPSTMT
jgi:hypothetical protein